jgi:hypothetical protein
MTSQTVLMRRQYVMDVPKVAIAETGLQKIFEFAKYFNYLSEFQQNGAQIMHSYISNSHLTGRNEIINWSLTYMDSTTYSYTPMSNCVKWEEIPEKNPRM